jgi:hypothetical protein
MLSQAFPGWSLSDLKEMTPRERRNWFELAKEDGRLVSKQNGK